MERAKQKQLPGAEDAVDPKILAKQRAYVEARNIRIEAWTVEKKERESLHAMMKAAGITTHRDPETEEIAEIVTGEEKVYVRKAQSEAGEGD